MNFKANSAQTAPPLAIDGRNASLRRKIQASFALAALMTVLTGGGLFILFTGVAPDLPISLLDKTAKASDSSQASLPANMRCWLAGGLFLVITALAALYLFLMRRVVNPLERMAAAAHQMINGRLDAAMPVQDTREMRYLGNMFNDMGVNLQELVLLIWNQTGSALQTIEGIRKALGRPQSEKTDREIKTHLRSVQQSLGTLQSVAQSFDLYDVLLTDHKAVALEDHCDRASQMPLSPGGTGCG